MRKRSSTPVKGRSIRKNKAVSPAGLSGIHAKALGEILYESHNEIYIFDAKTLRFLFANKGALENLGYTIEEMYRLTPLSLDKQYTLALFRKLINPLLKQKNERLFFEGSYRRKDGSVYPVEANLQVSRLGKSPVFVAIIRDIGDKKHSEEAIHILHKAIENAGEGIAISDVAITGNPIVYVNEEFANLYGYKRAEIYGKGIHHFLDKKENAEIIDKLNKSQLKRERFRSEVLCRKKNNTTFWNELAVTPMMDDKGRVNHFIFFNRDITLQRLAVEELERSYFNLQLLDRLNTTALGNVGFNELAKMVVDIFYSYLNPLWCRFYKYDKSTNTIVLLEYKLHKNTQKMKREMKNNIPVSYASGIPETLLYAKVLHTKKAFYADNPDRIDSLLKQSLPNEQFLDKTKSIFQSLSVRCCGVIPMVANGEAIGFVTFGTVKELKSKDKETIDRFVTYISAVLSRHITQEALKVNEEKYRNIFESIHDVFYRTDNNGVITTVSPSVYDLSGFRPHEMIGRKATEFYQHPTDRKKLLEELKKKSHVENFETSLVTKKGVRAVSSNVKLMLGKNNTVIGEQGVIRDITDKLKSQKALKDSEEKFRSLTESAPHFIAMISRKYDILYLNKVPEGYVPDALMGTCFLDFIKSEDREKIESVFTDVFEKGITASYEAQGKNADGTFSWYSTTIGPLKKEGKISSAILISENINAKKRAEQLVKIQNGVLEKIAVNTGVFDVITPLSEECRGYFNADFCTIMLLDEDTGSPRITYKQYMPHELIKSIAENCGKIDGIRINCRLIHNKLPGISNTDFSISPCCDFLSHNSNARKFQSSSSLPLFTSYGKHVGNFILLYSGKHTPTQKDIQDMKSLVNLVIVALEQEKYEKELQQLYNSLERRVQERTEEVVKKNKAIHEQQVELEKQKSIQYRLQFLSAQMNPHFIFNSISSIQYFLFDENKENTLAYISNLSSLFRQALNNSEKEFITLEEEIEFLNIYLDLESKRMKGKLSYEVIIDNELEVSGTLIPPMLVQPYIENAIHHGITPKDGDGKIEVSFRLQDKDTIVCRVSDNGIGMERSQQMKTRTGKNKHKSLGMSIIQTRMVLLNSIQKKSYIVQVEKGNHENQSQPGTVISITIPLLRY